MFGISIFVSLLTPAPLKATLRHRLNLCLTCTITVSLLTTVAILLAQSGLMGNGWPDSVNPSVIYAVLGTTFGQAWLGQLTLASVSALCLFMSPQVRFNIIAGLSTALLINLGFVGHVTINTGLLGIVHRLNHLIHLLSGGYWLGTLIPLLVCLRYLSDPAQRNYAIKTMIKFSNFGHAAVFLVILTGSINTIIILGSWPNDWLSPYQQLLSLKILMVAVMVGIAL